MPISDTSPNYKRANLFLLRVWCDDADENEHEQGNRAGSPSRRWHGKVQRTVSGEEHSFGAKEEFIGVLEAMMYKDRMEHSSRGQRGETSTEAGLPASGNNQSEGSEVTEGTR